MNYVNRMFFRTDTGEMVYRYTRQGTAPPATILEDMAALQPLSIFLPEALICVETPETDTETIAQIEQSTEIYLNVSTMEVVYSYTPPANPAPTIVERVSALEDALLMLM